MIKFTKYGFLGVLSNVSCILKLINQIARNSGLLLITMYSKIYLL